MTKMRFTSLLIVIPVLLGGCAVVSHDRTAEPGMDAIIGKSFAIQKDSFLIESYCSSDYTTESCLFMQIAGGSIERNPSRLGGYRATVELPGTLADYGARRDAVNDELVERSIFGNTRHDIVATVPKGTVITVTRVVDKAEGESGRCWVVYGSILSQSGTSIQIGACRYAAQGQPMWFEAEYKPAGANHPQPLPEFLLPVSP